MFSLVSLVPLWLIPYHKGTKDTKKMDGFHAFTRYYFSQYPGFCAPAKAGLRCISVCGTGQRS